MTMKKYNHPSESSRPFDTGRSGFILGEGAGVLILEVLFHLKHINWGLLKELEHAKRRNAKIYAEILAYGSSGNSSCLNANLWKFCVVADGYHLTRPEETGDGAYRAMAAALRQAGINILSLLVVKLNFFQIP